jgi:hypothetical protein
MRVFPAIAEFKRELLFENINTAITRVKVNEKRFEPSAPLDIVVLLPVD